MNTKVILGVSGGVDSAIAAHLLLEEGYEVIGVYLYLQEHAEEGIEDARRVCQHLNIPFQVLEAREIFNELVIKPFIDSYKKGLTPNPCVICNETVKFKLLIDEANRQGAAFVATGHYSRIEKNERYLLRQGLDLSRDQSYMLYRLKQDQLSRLLFPLSAYSKDQVREIGRKIELPIFSKKDSQDICFIPTGDHLEFLKSRTQLTQGHFKLRERDLGPHKGIEAYTPGQRRGLGISHSHPLYVKSIDEKSGEVNLSSEEELYSSQVLAEDINFIYRELEIGEKVRLQGRVRYSQKAYYCTVERLGSDELKADFDEPLRAPSPGQSLVLYKDDYIFGGGIIKKTSISS